MAIVKFISTDWYQDQLANVNKFLLSKVTVLLINIMCYPYFQIHHYCPRNEASAGYVFTGVCHSVTERGREVDNTKDCPPPGPGQNTQAGGTHPTGMDSCL